MFKHSLHEIRRELTIKIRVALNYSEEVPPKINFKISAQQQPSESYENLIIIKHSKL
jgi:hypothetical protein